MHTLGFAVLHHSIRLPDEPRRDTALRALRRVMTRPGLPTELRHDCAQRGYTALCIAVDARELDTAAAVYAFLTDLSGDRSDPGTFVEQGKAATELIQAYLETGRHKDAVRLIRQAMPVLRTPEYLAAREHDLGQSSDEFLAALESLAR